MSLEIYKILHLLGILMVFTSLIAIIYKRTSQPTAALENKRMVVIIHGVGMALTLVAGFGLLARLGMISGFPGWVWAKIGIWVVAGLAISFALRKKQHNLTSWLALYTLFIFAAILAFYKPF